jgi:hypothetical protein
MTRLAYDRCATRIGWTVWGRPAVVVLATIFAALLFAPVFAVADDAALPYEPVVPPGQEALLSTMLGRGAALPDKCKFAGGGADGTLIRSTYACPSGEVVLELTHPSNATPNATHTENFAIIVEHGAPPEALIDALVALIRPAEADFEWKWLSDDDVSQADAGGGDGDTGDSEN